MHHFIASNRAVVRRANASRFTRSGYDYPKIELRFAKFDMQTTEYTLYADIPRNRLDDIGRVNYGRIQQGSAMMFQEIYQIMKNECEEGKGDLLVFVHGFGNNEQDILNHFEKLQKHYVEGESNVSTVLIFYWTTNGKKLSPKEYRLDAYDAWIAGQALSRLYYKLIDFIKYFFKEKQNEMCKNNIHLMCHSMGNQVLKHMMDYLSLPSNVNKDPIYEIFKEIILVAPDVEYNIFEPGGSFQNLFDLGERVHVYCHRNDLALKISKNIHQIPRLGAVSNPRVMTQREKLIYVNARRGTKGDWQGIQDETVSHWYHYHSEDIISDINRVLKGETSNYKIKLD